jgi:DNA-binding winged helix-turn-helix (wHTH) protein/tetratricopeptide (TPR) repeat protein
VDNQSTAINHLAGDSAVLTPQALHAGFCLGDITILPSEGFIVVRGEHHHVTPKALEVLLQLAQHAEETVSQQQILEAVWGDEHAAKGNVVHAISELRHVMGDHKECPVFIQTLPRRGYRLLLPVTPLTSTTGPLVERRGRGNGGHYKQSWLMSLFRGSRLFSVSVAFLVSVWLFIQVMAITFPLMNISTTGMKLTLLVLLIGFPIVLLITWTFDLRERKKRLALSDNPHKHRFWRRQLFIDLGFLLMSFSAVALLGRSVKLAIDADTAAQAVAGVLPVDTTPIANSVAVLPFELSNGSVMEDYLLQGIRQELLYSLTQLNQFPVLADRAMQAIPANASYQQVAEQLRVEFIVEGQVSADSRQLQLEISVVEAATGVRLWSNRLTDQSQQLPALQQELHRRLQNAFTLIMPQTSVATASSEYRITESFKAFDAYMQAQQRLKQYDDLASLEQAEQLLLLALQADPDFATASATLCKVHLDKYVLSRSVEEFNLARQACQHAAGLKVNQAQVYATLGDLYRISGEYSQATTQYDQALAVNERWVDALTGKAMILSANSSKIQAEQLFNKAIELEPGYWQNYMHYGRFLYGNGRFDAAARRFERASQLKPGSTDVLNSLAAAWFFSGQFEQAITAWLQVVQLAPLSSSFSNLGTAYYFHRDYTEAEQMYRQALSISSDDYTIWTNLADVLDVQPQRRQEALPLYQKALTLARQNLAVDAQAQPLLSQISRLQAELQHCEAALQTELQLLAGSVTDFYVFYDLAVANYNCQRNNSGAVYAKQAVNHGYPAQLIAADPKLPQADRQYSAVAEKQ